MLAQGSSLRRRGSALLLVALTCALADGVAGDGRAVALAAGRGASRVAGSLPPSALTALGDVPDPSHSASAPLSVAFTAPSPAQRDVTAPARALASPAPSLTALLRPAHRRDQVPPAAVDPAPGCAWQLAGTWSVEGVHTAGRLAGRVVRTSVTFRQIDDQLVGTQTGERITLYGRCSIDYVDLEIWRGWDYIGHHVGRIAPDGLTIAAAWTVWNPDPMEGEATLSGRARRVR